MTWLASCGQVDYRTHLEIYCTKMKNYKKIYQDGVNRIEEDFNIKVLFGKINYFE